MKKTHIFKPQTEMEYVHALEVLLSKGYEFSRSPRFNELNEILNLWSSRTLFRVYPYLALCEENRDVYSDSFPELSKDDGKVLPLREIHSVPVRVKKCPF